MNFSPLNQQPPTTVTTITTTTTTTTKKQFICIVPGCDKSFGTKPHLNRHSLKHTGAKRLQCNVPGCTSTFYRTDALNQHQRSHQRRYEQEYRPANKPTAMASPPPSPPTPQASHSDSSNTNIESWLLEQAMKRKTVAFYPKTLIPEDSHNSSHSLNAGSLRKTSISFLCE
ncbi:hypothetical protein BDR26DRAFT_848952 [Obelidium mucronatum]|nr:hypothetical protein BDR26DRAFT_848952 [Obelidium mucronatum]